MSITVAFPRPVRNGILHGLTHGETRRHIRARGMRTADVSAAAHPDMAERSPVEDGARFSAIFEASVKGEFDRSMRSCSMMY
ncbi:hypothetical protein [Burkholderia gladioli]|uniref:hypothetical protein n=1 Tax=Burkholderia gladioli TaxID=28095 RepID=UPI0016404F72|nr:hypothetical protein [Burkholderia gladioli]MDN7598301.1 hypothetical protein [Burkholderia gladioli]